MAKVTIKQDKNCSMLSIDIDNETLFFGDELNFGINVNNFKKLFEQLGLEVEIIDAILCEK